MIGRRELFKRRNLTLPKVYDQFYIFLIRIFEM